VRLASAAGVVPRRRGVAGTVWNSLHGFESTAHIKDFDLVYFDEEDLSYGAEDVHIQRARTLFADLPAPVEVRNEARVHLWYEAHFGIAIDAYPSLEAAIASWPTTATSVGVRTGPDGDLTTYAPFGLEDLMGLVVRPNKSLVTREIYEEKAERWAACWPHLTVLPW
jgi:hypothetical protein